MICQRKKMPLCPISIVNSIKEVLFIDLVLFIIFVIRICPRLLKISLFFIHSFLFLFVFSLVLFIIMIITIILIIMVIMIIITAILRFSLLSCPPLVLFSLLYTNIYIFFCQRKKKNTKIQICLVLVYQSYILFSFVLFRLITLLDKIDEFERIAMNMRAMLKE